MYYLLFAFPLLIYFELLGRLFFYYIKKEKLEFNFIIGFCLLIAFLYVVGWPISVYGLASIYYVILVSVFIITSIILIIINFKKLDLHLNIKLWILFAFFLAISIFISFNRTLGEPHGFDTLFYINFVGYNVDTPMLNSINTSFGGLPDIKYHFSNQYSFQSYYYFASSIIFIIKRLASLINLTIESMPSFVWTFQIILSSFFIASSIDIIKHINIKNKIINISLFIVLVLFMGNFYYNNCFGFYGNSYRMPIHSIATLYLVDYLSKEDKKDFFIFGLLMISLCGFSSSGTFSFVFIMFALFFVLVNKEDNLIRYYSFLLFFPTLNILFIKLNDSIITILITLLFFAFIYLFNNYLVKIFRIKYVKPITIILISIILISISALLYTYNYNFLEFFFDNHSEISDMSWDYFYFYDLRHWIFNLLVLIPMFYYVIKYRNKKFSMIIWILIFTIFNPFSANLLNGLFVVYYRAYDIIINQFTISFFIFFLIKDLKYNKLLSLALLISSVVLCVIQVPRYYHDKFVPDDDYNHIYKIEQSELDLIWNIKNMIKEYNIQNPKIINPIFYSNTYIKNGSYLIGREKRPVSYNDINAFELYKIVFPTDGYDNFRPSEEPDYDNLTTFLNNTDYNIFVVDYEKYFDYKGKYMSLSQVLESEGYVKEDKYSTLKYAVFYLK